MALSPPPIEVLDHHRQPDNPIDGQPPPPEDVENHRKPPIPALPPEELHDRRQTSPENDVSEIRQSLTELEGQFGNPTFSPNQQPSPSISPTGPENPTENLDNGNLPNPNSSYSPNHQRSPSISPTGPENPAENPDYRNLPNLDPNFSPNQQPSPSISAIGPGISVEKPDYRNPNSNFSPDQQPSPSILPVGPGNPVENPNYPNYSNPNPSPSPKVHQSPQAPTTTSPPSPREPLEPSTEEPPPDLPLGLPLLLLQATAVSPSKPQPSAWTHQETANLIQAYQEKWYSLKKGPLKASQWEEVAITVAARCGYDEPTKSAKQCRHKIEKLRKRYRAERGKPGSKAAAWNFFKLMDNLEKGPLPISSSRPLAMVEYSKPSNSNGKRQKNDDSDGELHVNKKSNRSKSSNHHFVNGGLTGNLRFSDGVMRGTRTSVLQKHKGFDHDDSREEEEEEDGYDEGEEGSVVAQLAVEIKSFAEKFVKMENKKIEMIRDTERYRMEMENKRMEMILESQQMIVETVNKAFSSSRETQKLSAS